MRIARIDEAIFGRAADILPQDKRYLPDKTSGKAVFLLYPLCKGEVLANITKRSTNLYLTPNDVDLKING